MKIKNAQPDKDWLSVAIDLGYYDYQHLVRDFKEFTNPHPQRFLCTNVLEEDVSLQSLTNRNKRDLLGGTKKKLDISTHRRA